MAPVLPRGTVVYTWTDEETGERRQYVERGRHAPGTVFTWTDDATGQRVHMNM
jgi:hypothetical protein